MISLDFSISRKAVEFIYEQRTSESHYRLIQFTQREIVTRIVGVSLSILIIADFGIHSIGVGEKTFYALYKAIFDKKPIDFSLPIKHLKCLKLFLCTFFNGFYLWVNFTWQLDVFLSRNKM